jgi:hypothetical protein
MEDAALSTFSVFFTQPAPFLAYQRLIQSDQTLPNQLGKATQQPTLSWVFKEVKYHTHKAMWLVTRPQGSVTYGQLTVPCPTDAAELFVAGRIGFCTSHLWGIPALRGWL